MRRLVASSLCVPAGVLVVVLASVHTLAQPATRPLTLRPAFEDNTSEDAERRDRELAQRRAPPRRTDQRPAGTLPNFDNTQANELPRFGNPSGSGAGNTGFLSTNRRQRPAARGAARRPATAARPGSLTAAPPSLTAPGTSPTATLLRSTASGTSVRATTPTAGSTTATPPADSTTPTAPGTPVSTAAVTVPRGTLVRIPDGTATGGIAGTLSTTRLTPLSTNLLRRRTALEEDPFAPIGGHPGSFVVLPALEITGGYDTNPARVPGGTPSAFAVIAPEVIARSDWTRHEVTAALRGSYTTYDKTPELDRPALDSKITGRFDVTRDTALIGEGTFIVGTDNPGSPNVQAGLTRFPIYTTLGAAAGVRQNFNRVEVTAKGIVERTAYQDSHFTDGSTESNADRDYNRFGGSLRGSYDLMPGLKPFVEVAADTRQHDLQFDRFGLQRDSTGWQIKGGSSFDFSRMLTGEASIGWISRTYVDPSLQELSGFLFDASLIYSLTALTKIKLLATTTASETTVPGTAGTLTRNAGVEVEHSFRRWLIGAVKFNYGNDDYVGSARRDNRYSIGGTILYKLNRYAQAKAEVRHEWLRSTTPVGVDYDATVFQLGMRLQY